MNEATREIREQRNCGRKQLAERIKKKKTSAFWSLRAMQVLTVINSVSTCFCSAGTAVMFIMSAELTFTFTLKIIHLMANFTVDL